MCKHGADHNCHARCTYQKHLSIFEFFCRCKFKYEGVVDARFAPHEDVATVEEEVKKQQTKHATIQKGDES